MTILKETQSEAPERMGIEMIEVAASLIKMGTTEAVILTEDERIATVLTTMAILRWTRSETNEYRKVPLRRKSFHSPRRPRRAACWLRILHGQGSRVTLPLFPAIDIVTTHRLRIYLGLGRTTDHRLPRSHPFLAPAAAVFGLASVKRKFPLGRSILFDLI